MTMIDQLPQQVQYSKANQRLHVKLVSSGADAEVKAATTPKVSVYDPTGTKIEDEENLTQQGTTAWWYIDLDCSDTDEYPKGLYYRAIFNWTDDSDSLIRYDHILFDCVVTPVNEPLVTTEAVDADKPAWAGIRPSGWSDWTNPIFSAHRELLRFLREIEVEGVKVRPELILDKGKLYDVEMALVQRNIVNAVSRLEDLRESFNEQASAELVSLSSGPFVYDMDADDLVDQVTEENVAGSGFKFGH